METKYRQRIHLTNPWHLLAVGFGSGLSPVMPGTLGTLAAIPFYLFFSHLLSSWSYAIVTLLMALVGIIICQRTSDDMGVHDHGGIVWDEFAGYFITMLFVPVGIINVLVGFVLFRFFDIVKPWPICLLDQKVQGGLGIMVDDVVAGIMACVCLHALLPLLSGLA